LSGDDAELDRAEASLRAGQDRANTLKTPLAEGGKSKTRARS
jgi:hypothetical protein